MFFCPGCKCGHTIWTSGPVKWEFNGNFDKPTFRPSIMVNGSSANMGRCHSFVTDGQIQFLHDCSHQLAGQTVSLADF